MQPAIRLVETREDCGIFETQPRYDVLLDGRKVGQLYFHMRGYTGCNLPQPNDVPLLVGERAISAYRRAIARLNREWAAARRVT